MINVNDYQALAKQYETVFRNILIDLQENREKRPLGYLIPEDLDVQAPLDKLLELYSQGDRQAKFTIHDFSRPSETTAKLNFSNMSFMSGGGAGLEYAVNTDNSVKYVGHTYIMLS